MNIEFYILSILERFAHRLERSLGIHPFTCAALGNMVASVTFFEWTLTGEAIVPFLVLCAFVFVVLSLVFLGMTPYFIRKHYILISGGGANPRKIEPAMMNARFVASVGLVISLFGLIFLIPSYFVRITLIILGLWVFLYFWSCDPLPPSRVRSFSFV